MEGMGPRILERMEVLDRLWKKRTSVSRVTSASMGVRMTERQGSTSFTLRWAALDKHVLLVAVNCGSADCNTYVGAVEGKNYDEEALGVVVDGSVVWGLLSEVYFRSTPGRVRTLFGKEIFSPDDERFLQPGRKHPPGVIEMRPIDKHVLVVAVARPGRTWKAYIGAVKGDDYYEEASGVVANGSEIPFELAEVCFKDLAKGSVRRGEEWYIPPPTEREIQQMRKDGVNPFISERASEL